MHAEIEEDVYANAASLRQQGICVTLAGIARDMRRAVGSILMDPGI